VLVFLMHGCELEKLSPAKSSALPDADEMKSSDMPAFYFQRRRGRIDWRKLDRVDLEAVVNDVDIETLQEHVDHIAFADVGEEGGRQHLSLPA
jgi:hypothetical protein